MKSIEQVEKFNDKKFQKTFGVSKITFATMMSVLQRQFIESHKRGGRPPKVTVFGRLCIFFAYYRATGELLLTSRPNMTLWKVRLLT